MNPNHSNERPNAQARHRRNRVAAIDVGAAAALALATSGVLLASPAKSHGVTRMHLVEVEVATSFVDAQPKGISLGDVHTITSDIFDTKHRLVGRGLGDLVG